MVDADKKYVASRNSTMFTSVGTRSANAYKKFSVEAGVAQADSHKLVEMLFEGLLSNVGAARAALERGDIKAKCQHVVTAVRILEEGLQGSLNLEEGGVLAANLRSLYDYAVLRLTQANARNDDALLQEVLAVMAPIADGWKQIGGSEEVSKHVM
jgi:flagellar protein FliS